MVLTSLMWGLTLNDTSLYQCIILLLINLNLYIMFYFTILLLSMFIIFTGIFLEEMKMAFLPFFSKDNVGSQLIVMLLSISMWFVLIYAHYDSMDNSNTLVADQLWTASIWFGRASIAFTTLFMVSFFRLVYAKNVSTK